MNPGPDTEFDQIEAAIRAELPELLERATRRRLAIKEDSISGQLRRALAGRQLKEIAKLAQVDVTIVADWFSGDASLPSNAIDRIAHELHLTLQVESAK